jgi:hypothetical protein
MWCDVKWCDVMWCDVMWCDVMWSDVMWCDVMWCDVMWCDVMWCDVMWSDVMWCDVMWCGERKCNDTNYITRIFRRANHEMLRRVGPVLMLYDSYADNCSCTAEKASVFLGLTFSFVPSNLIYAIGRDHVQMTIRLWFYFFLPILPCFLL